MTYFFANGKTKDGDEMKDLFRTFLLIAVGLMAAIIVYPFLHEMGHAVTALIVGTKVSDIQFLPVPSTVCQINTSNQLQIIAIGFGGIILPFLVTALKPPKRFIAWYLWFAIKGICILSFAISLWTIIFHRTGLKIATDDMNQVMSFFPEYKVLYCIVILALLIIAATQEVCSNPIKICMQYFGV